MRRDLQHVSGRVDLEEAHDSTRSYIANLHEAVSAQSAFLGDLHSHVEDLDNRGRRNNIRVRGLPEATRDEDLHATLEAIFNLILGEPSSHKIKLDRAHRALRPRPTSGPPRDVICCVNDFQLKERIMAKSRTLRDFDFDGAPIQLFQDLSWITLRKRKMLQPLLSSLRSALIPYRWSFPFALQARRDGRSAVLRSHPDIPEFCAVLDLQIPKLPDWALQPPPPPPPPVWQPVRGKRRGGGRGQRAQSSSGSRHDPT
ncbi:uncharacterized protein LOC130282688 isoform X2 [Hyla sarda]|uniref:uncharacterized protein LOC130282688 isoform X2 n=1 Tax=Hyla sarda TaxID=327740 RepID=UPI0024C458A3|nr:uncharacterized protein LOC130282688 isoform X2 [Hyla sarda]